jgi:uncharacterized LabA/DUF88 family protein
VALEPASKRAVAFFDGQNLYHAARHAFGYTYPNYDPVLLGAAVCNGQVWDLAEVRFYTGVPDRGDDAFWHHFWTNKLAQIGRRGAAVYSRSLVYRNRAVRLPDGSQHSYLTGEEKGIDVRLAIDIISMAWQNMFDVALVFSQDQDLSEVAREIREIGRWQNRWIKIASAFPYSPVVRKARGIDWTDWIRIDRATYDACLDPRDYRPRRPPPLAESPKLHAPPSVAAAAAVMHRQVYLTLSAPPESTS